MPVPRKAATVLRQVAARRRPRSVLFNSFGGRFSDNPRGVYEALVRRQTDLLPTWVAGRGVPLPAGVAGVEPQSADYHRAAGAARFVVSNERMTHYVKKPGVTYVQTWHGTPLKKIGYDNPRYGHDRDGMARAARDYRRWDLLVTQNAFSTEVLRRAFRYEGEVLEVGYPRNDVLLSDRADAIRRSTRARFGVPEGTRVVLYAPTFRDDGSGVPLDLARMQAALGGEAHVLTRLHHRDATRLAAAPSPFWSSADDHPDIRDLYLASDVLVTDYSSSMFDYGVTGKPIVYFTYDLEQYRDDLRGFYFDLEAQAPGPLCRTSDEVAEALAALDAVERDSAAAYGRFRQAYCSLDDGRAGARVVDRLLASL
jgi:CDP-glycerol glycerophosphotransferase